MIDKGFVWDYTQAVYECYASPAILTLKGGGRQVGPLYGV